MRRPIPTGILLLSFLLPMAAQQPPSGDTQHPSPGVEQNPPVKINYLNVCTPPDSEKDEIAATLGRIPRQPKFVTDFEVSRGLSSIENAENSRYVRLRREFPSDSKFSTVQYSISNNGKNTIETLVLSGRDVKELRQISIENSVSSNAANLNTLLSVETPASRVKVERFGKSSLGLARCERVDQSKFEPLFAEASSLLASYRKSMGLRTTMSNELRWLARDSQPAANVGKSKSAPQKPK